ncbi:MAG TPA: phage tail protein [Flavobacteriales bacterium]|nr:phage tail protein [Flavobacteriales bacterium]
MATVLATPGVYIEEKSAFPSSAVQVATAVPAFVGYTEMAIRANKSLKNIPTRITSLSEFHQFFGGAPKTTFAVSPDDSTQFKVDVDAASKYNLYRSMRMFFANGGSLCYVVSVGSYSDPVSGKDLNDPATESGIPTLLKYPEPTMLVIPDAVLLEEADCFSLQQAMLMHCGSDMKSRVAVLDIYNGDKPRTYDEGDIITRSREGVGNNFLQWGASYYPFLNTTIVQGDEVDFSNISNLGDLVPLLNNEADALYGDDSQIIKDEIAKLEGDNDPVNLHQTLLAKLPLYKAVLAEVRNNLNVLPASGGMAGVISMVDGEVGVFQSPANVSLGSVVGPTVNLTSRDQEDLNLPLNGKAINAIRSFPGKGVLVWGARTLDGNSQDWRYLSVRRTVIMIEQSLKSASEAYVFEPNQVNTWVAVKGMMTNFLKDQWKQGALAGAVPEDAFSVDIGLGSTMTPTDILDGIMRVTVKLAVTRPAEFIVITFQQQMQQS